MTRALPIVVLGFVACNVYNADLLSGPARGGAAGSSGSGATSGGPAGGLGGNAGAVASAGSSAEAGAESTGDAGDDGGGTGGVSGSSTVGEGGEAAGGSAGSSGRGGTTGGGGSKGGSGGNAGAGSGGTSGAGAGSGGAGSGGGGGVTGTIDELLIDDFEDGNHQIALMGQIGYWYSYNDGTGTQTPAPVDPFAPVTVSPPIDGSSSTKAVHVRWQGMTIWGGGFGAAFTEDSTVYYDASAYDGITFWARIESGSETRIDLIFAEQRSLEPACTVCGHHPTYALTVSTSWQRFYLPFALFRGDGGGDPSFFDLDPSGLYGIQFFRGANQTVDLWVDDVSFYRVQ